MTRTMNEEEVKTKIVLPLLVKCGIQLEEISLERSFSLRLGRHTIQVDTQKQIATAQPRLDILVSKNGRNLFIIETKAEGLKLTEADRDQAVSYARLVHPIAPYAVTTNGTETYIYDTASKAPLTPEELTLVDGYQVTLSEDLRYEAQGLFLGYSLNNLRSFCTAQTENTLAPLVGPPNDRSRKYIAELHMPRQAFLEKIDAFLESDKPLFALLGDSGVGKTSSLCHLVYHLRSRGEAVLFFKGVNLRADLLEEIGLEFNWNTPDAGSPPIAVLKRVEDILDGRRLIVIVDSIDEWNHQEKIPSFAWLISHLSHSSLKLIVSCKLNSWKNFLEQRGTPTGVREYVYHEANNSPTNSSEPTHPPGYLLSPFDEREFYETLRRYRSFYSFYGSFENSALEEARRNPFFLRVLFEVAEHSQLENISLSTREIFDVYYTQLTRKTGDERLARKQLRAVAEVFFKENVDSFDRNDLEGIIGFGPDSSLLEDLFTHNILEQVYVDGREQVRFSFQGLRDYLIVFHVLKWTEVSVSEFSESIKSVQKEGVHQEVLQLFYRQGDQEKNRLLDRELRVVAERYLDTYISILDKHCPFLKNSFSPRSTGNIGFIATISLAEKRFAYYGFRKLRDTDERVLFVPVDEVSWHAADILAPYGAHSLQANHFCWDFRTLNIMEVILNFEIVSQLGSIIHDGFLDEGISQEMAIEMIAALVEKHDTIFNRAQRLDGERSPFPISFIEIRKCLRRKKLWYYFEEERYEHKKQKGEIVERFEGGTVSASYTWSHKDRDWIREQTDAALREVKKVPRERRVNPDSSVEERFEAAARILEPEFSEVQGPLFPMSRRVEDLSSDEILNHAARVFKLFLETYKKIVERNFPTFCHEFTLYKKMPLVCFLGLPPATRKRDPTISISLCQNPQVDEGNRVVTICSDQELIEENWQIQYQGQSYKCFTKLHRGWIDFVSSWEVFSDVQIGHSAVLRAWVYKQISEEMDEALHVLFDQYGVQRGGKFRVRS